MSLSTRRPVVELLEDRCVPHHHGMTTAVLPVADVSSERTEVRSAEPDEGEDTRHGMAESESHHGEMEPNDRSTSHGDSQSGPSSNHGPSSEGEDGSHSGRGRGDGGDDDDLPSENHQGPGGDQDHNEGPGSSGSNGPSSGPANQGPGGDQGQNEGQGGDHGGGTTVVPPPAGHDTQDGPHPTLTGDKRVVMSESVVMLSPDGPAATQAEPVEATTQPAHPTAANLSALGDRPGPQRDSRGTPETTAQAASESTVPEQESTGDGPTTTQEEQPATGDEQVVADPQAADVVFMSMDLGGAGRTLSRLLEAIEGRGPLGLPEPGSPAFWLWLAGLSAGAGVLTSYSLFPRWAERQRESLNRLLRWKRIPI